MNVALQWLDPARYPFLLVPALWLLITLISSGVSGWFTLASRFRKHSEPCGEARTALPWFSPVYMRYWSKDGPYRLTAADDALYLSVPFFCRFGHPPLRIPWDEIQFSTDERVFSTYVVLTLGNEERIPLRITTDTARKLGILDRVPGGSAFDVEPNFDQLPDNFPDPSGKKPN
jgi:hypothetical protein